MKYFKTFLLSLFLFPTLSYGVTYLTTLHIYYDDAPQIPVPENIYCTGSVEVTAPYEVTRGSTFIITNKAKGGLCPERPVDFDRIESSLNLYPNLFVVWKRYDPLTDSNSQATFNTPPTGNFDFESEIMMNTFYSPIKSAFGFENYTVLISDHQCSDSINNDGQQGADTLDPECHTDCNVNNAGSYTPNHNSETTPPNGTCPTPPTLELNARAAFFQVVKNFIAFITTKAFAVTK